MHSDVLDLSDRAYSFDTFRVISWFLCTHIFILNVPCMFVCATCWWWVTVRLIMRQKETDGCTVLTLRKIAIWLSKSCQGLDHFFQKNCQWQLFWKNENFWQFFWKGCQVFGNFLTVEWQCSGGSGTVMCCCVIITQIVENRRYFDLIQVLFYFPIWRYSLSV